MDRDGLRKLEDLLKKNGYKKSSPPAKIANEDYNWYKSFEYENPYIPDFDKRPQYQVFFAIWDFGKYKSEYGYSYQVYIEVSRTISELVKITLTSIDSNTTIEEIEAIAKKFFKFVEDNFSIGDDWILIKKNN